MVSRQSKSFLRGVAPKVRVSYAVSCQQEFLNPLPTAKLSHTNSKSIVPKHVGECLNRVKRRRAKNKKFFSGIAPKVTISQVVSRQK